MTKKEELSESELNEVSGGARMASRMNRNMPAPDKGKVKMKMKQDGLKDFAKQPEKNTRSKKLRQKPDNSRAIAKPKTFVKKR